MEAGHQRGCHLRNGLRPTYSGVVDRDDDIVALDAGGLCGASGCKILNQSSGNTSLTGNRWNISYRQSDKTLLNLRPGRSNSKQNKTITLQNISPRIIPTFENRMLAQWVCSSRA